MSDWPKNMTDVVPRGALSTADENSPLLDLAIASGLQWSLGGTWAQVNTAFYFPVLVRAPVTVYQLAWGNTATLGSNVDVGIYDGTSKARLVSTGSTAQAGASQMQTVDVADTEIPPGLHYLAMAMDTLVGGVLRASLSTPASARLFGAAMQATFPLPSTATFSAMVLGTMPLIIAAIEGAVF